MDRISELPQHILEHIMGFLGSPSDVTRTSVLSKKFLSVWRSLPLLEFDSDIKASYHQVEFEARSSKSKIRDTEFVCDSMHYANDNICLQSLTIFTAKALARDSNCSSILTTVVELINFALRKQVKELVVDPRLFPKHHGGRFSCFPQLVSSSSESITTLKLSGFNLEAQHVTLSMPLIEVFTLRKCSGIASITLRGEKLRRVNLLKCYGLEEIQVDDPTTSIDSLTYQGKSYCDISLESTESVKFLVLWAAPITKEWLNSKFSRFVENLELMACPLREKSRWYFEKLKRLELTECSDCKVEFETPKLEWFNYDGNVLCGIPLVISSRKFDAKLRVSGLNFPEVEKLSLACYSDIIRIISHCQTLTFVCMYAKAHLIIPRAMRAQLNPQLNDLKHLIIEHFPPDIQNNMAEEVIDSLLWLAPRPNTISFITKFAVTDSIKFNYYEATSKSLSCSCGSSGGVKCWPQHLKEVELHKLQHVNENTLRNYFFRTYKARLVIIRQARVDSIH